MAEMIINDFYFEIGEIGRNVIRVAAFVTPNKPNITSNLLLADDSPRVKRLEDMFGKLSELKDYKVEKEQPGLLKAQGILVQVTGIRANISKKDESKITVSEVAELIRKYLV